MQFSLESEWKHISTLQNTSKSSTWYQRCCGLSNSSWIPTSFSRYCSDEFCYNWYHCHLHIPLLSQLSGKFQVRTYFSSPLLPLIILLFQFATFTNHVINSFISVAYFVNLQVPTRCPVVFVTWIFSTFFSKIADCTPALVWKALVLPRMFDLICFFNGILTPDRLFNAEIWLICKYLIIIIFSTFRRSYFLISPFLSMIIIFVHSCIVSSTSI